MDLNQRKLNKSEWDSIEETITEDEKNILMLIKNGYHNVNLKINYNLSLISFLKISYTEKMEEYLYKKYFNEKATYLESEIEKIDSKYIKQSVKSSTSIKKADQIRLDKNSVINDESAFEFKLLNYAELSLKYKDSKKKNQLFHLNLYTLSQLIDVNIPYLNKFVVKICKKVLYLLEENVDMLSVVGDAVTIIEKNKDILRYSDLKLYEHQKQIFTICKKPNPKMILYMAPTGTGKTMTPLGLSENNRVIFICAARHVGLALAKSAISINKKVAFAFGCSSADDIRLHYYSAKEYTKNKRSGGIGKVDNSVGNEVEIMICDIRSYLYAMYYMLAFNKKNDIIFYWDEPTITLDYKEHDYHAIISDIWKKNLIPNIVLSSATLPTKDEIQDTLVDFMNRDDAFYYLPTNNNESDSDESDSNEIVYYDNSHPPIIETIISYDCKKTIPIINNEGYVELPHYLHKEYSRIIEICDHCNNNLTMLRYFDLNEVLDFIKYVHEKKYNNSNIKINRTFTEIKDITMNNIKLYYLKLLQNILLGTWGALFMYFKLKRTPRFLENNVLNNKGEKIKKIKSVNTTINGSNNSHSTDPIRKINSVSTSSSQQEETTNDTTKAIKGTCGVYVTTKDAYTLTDGPTIFLCNNIEKVAKFCIQQANIPKATMSEIMKNIDYNNSLNEKISDLDNDIEHKREMMENNSKNETSFIFGGSMGRNKASKDCKKLNRNLTQGSSGNNEINKLASQLNMYKSMIKSISLNDMFVPNTHHHLKKWTDQSDIVNAFASNIEVHHVNKIMGLHGIHDNYKILLMMGIGIFIQHENITYMEIMKELAEKQKLYMIIASSDYIYGTNYQFCHAFISKDLQLTQEKIIQAMGRVGRNNIQQSYTVRFRDNEQIMKLFTKEKFKQEVENMNKLFTCR